jgi:WD40 repeat protein
LKFTTAAIFDITSFSNFIFVATADGTVYAISNERLSIVNSTKRSDKSARTLAVNPKKMELAVGYSDNWIRIFDIETLELKYEWSAHDNSVFSVRYSPNYKFLLSTSRDARLKAWNVGARYAQQTEVVAHMYAINHLDFSPDGKHFVTCSMDKSIKVWDAEEFQLLKVIDKSRHAGHGTSVNKLLWTNFSDQLVSASDDRTISIWNIIF